MDPASGGKGRRQGVDNEHNTILLISYIAIGDYMGTATLDATFLALADPTRRAILARLAEGEATVNELAKPFELSQPAVSKHLYVLEKAGLVESRVDGQRRPRSLRLEPMLAAGEWIRRYREVWEMNFQRLDAVLEELQRNGDGDAR
ncbi:helix-turn-helix transcriptional regulator [Pseudoruegeria sp. HB172150]|uniref:ArsR/SmtB family transcription factor n=1 Tax=Pseudoruegeria sp. HB172150 TaxID=2721164 RepID=UPI0020A634C6|nr:metalloregulator ArsR/SmtB family transcription factor [Pseudoruegeria sp. HB172150]